MLICRKSRLTALLAGLTRFGHDLYTVAAAPTKNTVISPLSIGFAFGMARAGAAGQTASQLDQVFGFPASGPHAAFNDLDRRIVTAGSPPPRSSPGATRAPDVRPAPPVVAIANGLFVLDGLPVRDGFLRTLAAVRRRRADLPLGPRRRTDQRLGARTDRGADRQVVRPAGSGHPSGAPRPLPSPAWPSRCQRHRSRSPWSGPTARSPSRSCTSRPGRRCSSATSPIPSQGDQQSIEDRRRSVLIRSCSPTPPCRRPQLHELLNPVVPATSVPQPRLRLVPCSHIVATTRRPGAAP